MKVLVSGGNGFLGRHIVKEFIGNNNVFSLSRTSGNYKILLEKEVPNFKDKFEVVIHAAGKAHVVPKSDIEKSKFYEVNVIGTINLLNGLEKSSLPKKFVFISSVAVYGKEFGNNINEDYPLLAHDAYGLSKIEAEKLIMNWCKENNVICTILRLPLLIGKNPPGNLGTMIKAINKGYYFNIGGGKARKSMILAEDVARFIQKVAQIGGVYNLTDGNHPNFNELSIAISTQNNKKSPYNLPFFIAKMIGFVGDMMGDKAPFNSHKLKKITSDLTFDDTKARGVAGWEPKRVLDWYNN